METEQAAEIRLERDPNDPGRTVLVGLHNETDVDDRIVDSVRGSMQLFRPVVGHLAGNRMRRDDPTFHQGRDTPPTPEQVNHMRAIRDELLKRIGGASLYRNQES